MKYNGDVILKNCKILLISYYEAGLNLSESLNILNPYSRSSSFSQIENIQSNNQIQFPKIEVENDEKIRFFNMVHMFKEKFGLKNKNVLIKKASRSFSKQIYSQMNIFEENKNEIEEIELKLNILTSLCKKEEKEDIKIINLLWEEMRSNEGFLINLTVKLNESIKNQDSLVIPNIFNLFKVFLRIFFSILASIIEN